jgi:hypothetical protein
MALREGRVSFDLGEKYFGALVNEEHRNAARSAQDAIKHARRCGEMLIEIKQAMKHGEWLPWLEKYCEFTPRTGQAYMKLAEGWSVIEAKYEGISHLTFSKALRILSENRQPLSPDLEEMRSFGGRFESMAENWQGNRADAEAYTEALVEWMREQTMEAAVRFGKTYPECAEAVMAGITQRLAESFSSLEMVPAPVPFHAEAAA